MKKILLFFLCCLLCTSAVFADDGLSDDSEPVPDNSSTGTPVVVDITQLLTNIQNDGNTSGSDTSVDEPQIVEILEPQLVSVTSQQQRISASDTSGLKAVLLSILGDYETTITDYEYRTGNNTYTSHSINIERDWTWICACGVFGLLLWCTFRTIGGICARW